VNSGVAASRLVHVEDVLADITFLVAVALHGCEEMGAHLAGVVGIQVGVHPFDLATVVTHR